MREILTPEEYLKLEDITELSYFDRMGEIYEVMKNYADYVCNQTAWVSPLEFPPPNESVLVKEPDGYIRLSNWRPSYKTFTCQNKTESSEGWLYKRIY